MMTQSFARGVNSADNDLPGGQSHRLTATSPDVLVGELIPGPRSSGLPTTDALREQLNIIQPTSGEPVFVALTGLSSRSPGWGSTERMPPQGQDASQRRILELEQAIRYMVDNPSDAPVIAARVLG